MNNMVEKKKKKRVRVHMQRPFDKSDVASWNQSRYTIFCYDSELTSFRCTFWLLWVVSASLSGVSLRFMASNIEEIVLFSPTDSIDVFFPVNVLRLRLRGLRSIYIFCFCFSDRVFP